MAPRLLPLLLSLSLVAGCQAPAATLTPRAAAAWEGPVGQVALSVAIKGTRRVQWVESYRATRFTAEVTGSGIGGWVPLTPIDSTTGEFGAMGVDGMRVASLAAKVPAGDRRIFRVKVYDTAPEPDDLLAELWGVGDVPANVTLQDTFPVTIKPMTTPTGQIFHRLLQVDAAKAMTLPIDSVQHFVEELLNTNAITGEALRSGVPQVDPSVLDVDKATAAILRGNAGVPFQIPAPIPEALLARDPADPLKRSLPDAMRQRGQVRARVVDLFGRTVSRPFVYYLTDWASNTQQADAETPADTTLAEVTPGSWTLVATDMERGTSARRPVSVAAGESVDTFVVARPGLEPVAGAYNMEADAENSFNGEHVPASLAYMSDPGGLFAHGGVLTYVDAGNQRVRRFDRSAPPAIVQTLAGTGFNGHNGDGGPGPEAWLALDNARDVVVDKFGVTYVAQTNNRLRAIQPDGTITSFWTPSGYAYDGLSRLAYDPDRHHLYVACPSAGGLFRLDLNVFTGANPAQSYDSAKVATTGISKIPMSLSRSSDIEVVGDYVYQSTYWQYSGGAADLYRCHVPTGQVEQVIGQSAKAIPAEDIAPADLDERYILGLAADNWGNLFFRADAGLYRLTQATGAVADMRVKLVLPDPAIRTVAFDRTAGELYLTRFQAFKNNAGTTRNVPVIVRVVP